MTGADFETAIYAAATQAVEAITAFSGDQAARYAAGLLDGARYGGVRIETIEKAVEIVMRAQDAAYIRAEAVGQ
ncbi:hypothetical protein [Sphingomonas sp. PR090111-T3T-6A]|uniref:hypothetical protein n=1 Tax=Sphingomonas sp. PR090111-T3T-6A TaxID=685778 RepID=UPI00035D68C6|nr:hypothetical protein [Sphingomonas sp. PR090111-T3T-6A]